MKKIICLALVCMLLALTGCNSFYWKEHQIEECVKEKWIKSAGRESKQKYLIGMQSGEVYQIKDSLMKWQWRSSDIYNQIDEGKCYDIIYFGWRMGIFSTYKVIYDVCLIPEETNENLFNVSLKIKNEKTL